MWQCGGDPRFDRFEASATSFKECSSISSAKELSQGSSWGRFVRRSRIVELIGMTGRSYSGCKAPRSASSARISDSPAMHQMPRIAAALRVCPVTAAGFPVPMTDRGSLRPGKGRRAWRRCARHRKHWVRPQTLRPGCCAAINQDTCDAACPAAWGGNCRAGSAMGSLACPAGQPAPSSYLVPQAGY